MTTRHNKAAGAQALAADELRGEFRERWQAGERPRIGEFLGRISDDHLDALLVSLVEIDWRERARRGETPHSDEYLEAFPAQSSALRGLFCRLRESESFAVGITLEADPKKPADANRTYRPGDTIGRYILERELGHGGFGVVWQARDPELGRAVAIKIVRPDRQSDPSRAASLLNEARKIAALNHPAILRVHDVLRDGDNLCVVTEIMPGGSLAARIARFQARPREAAAFVAQVAAGLHHAHLQGVVHRDVKPPNILLDAEGHPRIADFGLAVTEAEQLQESGQTIGTIGYMAPEIARGESHYADPRSDIYSLGVVLYQLLTQRLPFLAETAAQYIQQTIEREPRPLRTIDDRIPVELERIALKCLSRNLTERYSTARDLADELNRWLQPVSSDLLSPLPALLEISSAGNAATPVASTTPSSGSGISPAPPGPSRGPLMTLAIATPILAIAIAVWLARGAGTAPVGSPLPPKEPPAPTKVPGDPPMVDPVPPGAAEPINPKPAADRIEEDPLAAEFDADAPLGKWVTVLKRRPPRLLQVPGVGDPILTHDPNTGLMHAVSLGESYWLLGQTDQPRLEMQLVVQQAAWEGGIGLFFGMHDDEKRGPAFKRFQTVTIDQTTELGQKKIIVHNTFWKTDEFGAFEFKYAAPVGLAQSIPGRPVLLELEVSDGKLSVRLGGQENWSGPQMPVRGVGAEDFRGKFGLFLSSASGTFQNVRVKLPTKRDNP